MADNNKHINPDGMPPDSDLLLSYLKREMSNAEKHELEKRMLADDFMADAAEGLSGVNNPAVLAALTADVNAKFGTGNSGGKAPRSPLAVVGNTLAVAASIALLIVAGYFISQSVSNKGEQFAAAKEDKKANDGPVTEQLQEPSQPAADSTATPADATEEKPSLAQSIRTYRYKTEAEDVDAEAVTLADEATGAGNYEAPPQPVAEEKNSITTFNGATAPAGNTTANWDLSIYDKYGPASNANSYTPQVLTTKGKKQKAKANADVKADTIADQWGNRTAVAKDEDVPGYYVDGVMVRTEKEVGEGDTKQPAKLAETTNIPVKKQEVVQPESKVLKKGLEKYNKGDYKSAIGDLETALKADPGNYKAQYTLAMAYKNTNRPDNALKQFSAIQPASPFYENALWEKANIYLAKDMDNEAITTLKSIVKLNGAYKIQAQNMLKNLKEQKGQQFDR